MKNMKYMLSCLFLVFALNTSFAFVVATPSTIIVGEEEAKTETVYKNLTKDDILTMSNKELSQKMGKKLRLKDKLILGMVKRSLKKAEKKGRTGKKGGKFEWRGFLLGFFLGLIGVILAYVWLNKEYDYSARSAWFGLLAAFGLVLLPMIILLGALAA